MFKLSEEGMNFIKAELQRYEMKETAIIPCLFQVQKENNGSINEEIIEYLSEIMDIPQTKIQEVFRFYTMFHNKTMGKYHIQVCNNISCYLNGSNNLLDFLLKYLDVKINEVTKDGKFFVSQVECLGACDKSPAIRINDDYYEKINEESIIKILEGLD